jgi:ATPase subunit of ABC transporter with duplicated ATPase domains
MSEQAKMQDKIDAVGKLSGGERRRVALCRLLLEARHAAARRADQPSRRRIGRLARRPPADYPGAILIVTHDRYFLDNVTELDPRARPRRGIPYEGNYSSWLEQKQKRLEQEGREEPRASDAGARAGMDRVLAQGAPGQIQGALCSAMKSWLEGIPEAQPRRPRRSHSRPGRAARQNVVDFDQSQQGLRRPAADRRPDLQAAAGRHRRRDRPQRRRQDHAVPHDHRQEKPDSGRSTVGETVQLGYVDQSRDALDGKKTVWEEISGGNELISSASARSTRAAYCRPSTSRAPTSRRRSAAVGRRAQPRASGQDAEIRRQRAAARRADQRSRRRYLRALEEALEDFAGCAVIISHDRWFLDRIATHILAFEGDSHVEWFEGNSTNTGDGLSSDWRVVAPASGYLNSRRTPRVAEQPHPAAVLRPFLRRPGILHGAKHPLRMRHH